jgi:hypothetical protein
VTPADKLIGLEKEIFAERDRELEEARERRRKRYDVRETFRDDFGHAKNDVGLGRG